MSNYPFIPAIVKAPWETDNTTYVSQVKLKAYSITINSEIEVFFNARVNLEKYCNRISYDFVELTFEVIVYPAGQSEDDRLECPDCDFSGAFRGYLETLVEDRIKEIVQRRDKEGALDWTPQEEA